MFFSYRLLFLPPSAIFFIHNVILIPLPGHFDFSFSATFFFLLPAPFCFSFPAPFCFSLLAPFRFFLLAPFFPSLHLIVFPLFVTRSCFRVPQLYLYSLVLVVQIAILYLNFGVMEDKRKGKCRRCCFGDDFTQFLAALAILHHDYMKTEFN